MNTPPITIQPIELADPIERSPLRDRPFSSLDDRREVADAGARRLARDDEAKASPHFTGSTRHTRSHRLNPYLALATLVLPILARSQWPESYPQVPLVPLTCSDSSSPLAIDIIDDRSSSTYNYDPRHRREPELRQVVEWFDEADCHAEDAASVQHFDDVVAPLHRTPLTDQRSLDLVLKALPDRAPESSSTLSPTARRAASWASNELASHNVLIIATDGELVDLEAAFAALEQYPGTIHVLALGGDLPPEWAHAPSHSVTTLRREARLGDIARAIADEIRRASRHRDGREAAHG